MSDILSHDARDSALSSLLKASPDGFSLIDPDSGVLLDCNPALERLTGRSREQLVGMRVSELRPAELQPLVDELLHRVAADGELDCMVLLYELPGGELVPVEIQCWRTELAGHRVIASIARDITSRLELEADLAERERHARALLEVVSELESASTFRGVTEAVFDVVRAQLRFDTATLCRYPVGEAHAVRLTIRSVHPRIDGLPDGTRFEIAADPLLVELASGANVQVIEDARSDPRTQNPGTRSLDLRTSVRVASTLNDGSRAVLEFASIGEEGVRQLSEAQLDFARGVIAHAGAAIERILLAEARDRSSTVVEALHLATSSTAGQEFLDAFVQGLSSTLGVRHALVCRDDPDRPGYLRTLACLLDGELVPAFSYRAAGTPCADVRSEGECLVRRGVREAYPEDKGLVDMGADSFYGTRMLDGDGKLIGHCAVLHDRPFVDEDLVRHTVSLFASSAGLELQRQRATSVLERSLVSQHVVNELMGITLEDLPFAQQLQAALAVVLDSSYFDAGAHATIGCFEQDGSLVRAASLTAGGDPARTEKLWRLPLDGLFDSDNGGLVEGAMPDGEPVVGIPIRSGEQEFGVLKLIGHRRLQGVELRPFCLAVAKGIAGIISRHRARCELEASEQRLLQSQKLEALGSLAGGIAHDFNNLLTAMIGNADLLSEGLAPGSEEAQLLQGIQHAGLSAGQLTRQLLAFTRRQLLERVHLDLGVLVGEATRMLERMVPEDIAFRVELPEEPCVVLADRGQLEQVLMNLIVNARDAMRSGGELRVGVERSTEHRGFVRLTVTDTGGGMDEKTRSRIFEPFFTTKQAGEGTGLGLSVVYGIVSHHGGWIEVDSQPDGGARFDIFLPEDRATGPSAARVSDGEGLPTATPPRARVMVVEDDPAVREVSRAMLENLGYEVVEAVDGRAALSHLAVDGDFAALVLDVVMPGISGVDVFQAARADQPELPVLFVTGHDATERLQDLEGVRGVGLLRKPYTRRELGGRLAELIGSSTA